MPSSGSNKFKDFLLSEYSNIAQAHFKSIETISTFFRYYLLIMSIPLSAIAVISQIGSGKTQLADVVNQYELLISIILFCVSLIGLGVFCYVINLRLDVVLYARVVNGIRKFFYDEFNEDINLKTRLRILPQSPQLPSYFERSFFLPVVFVFGVMNSLYCFLGIWVLAYEKWISTMAAAFFLFHFLIYKFYAYHREISYLKSNILGIDIDGVLNKHREHFCKILKDNTSKNVTPERILIIPVHEHSSLGIERKDEREVFNDPRYWTDMPVRENAAEKIRNFRNVFNLKIFIFTYRPWPDTPDEQELIEKIKLFLQSTRGFTFQLLLLKIGIKLRLKWLIGKLKEEPLRLITKQWLRKNGVLYDKFVLEKGNDYSSDPRSSFKNRFYISRQKKIRFFVEDDHEKALKLSYICDVVFLLSHPYNEPNKALSDGINKLRESLPSNIIRVKDWGEIYQHIRRLS